MAETFAERVRAAARAGWWTFVIFAVGLAAAWGIVLGLMHTRPGWVLNLCGGGNFDWDALQRVYLWFFGVMKLILLVVLMATVFLALWSRRLRAG